MSNSVRRVWRASLILLACAAGSFGAGLWEYRRESQQLERWMESSGFFISHLEPDTNIWQVLGVLLLLVGVSVAGAAFMMWRRERGEGG